MLNKKNTQDRGLDTEEKFDYPSGTSNITERSKISMVFMCDRELVFRGVLDSVDDVVVSVGHVGAASQTVADDVS